MYKNITSYKRGEGGFEDMEFQGVLKKEHVETPGVS